MLHVFTAKPNLDELAHNLPVGFSEANFEALKKQLAELGQKFPIPPRLLAISPACDSWLIVRHGYIAPTYFITQLFKPHGESDKARFCTHVEPSHPIYYDACYKMWFGANISISTHSYDMWMIDAETESVKFSVHSSLLSSLKK